MSTARVINPIDQAIIELSKIPSQANNNELKTLFHHLRLLNAAISQEIEKEEKQYCWWLYDCLGRTQKERYYEIMSAILEVSRQITGTPNLAASGAQVASAQNNPMRVLRKCINSPTQYCSELRTLLSLVYNGLVELTKIILCGLIAGSLAAALISPLGLLHGFVFAVKSLILIGMKLVHGASFISSIHAVTTVFGATGEVAGLTAGAYRAASSLYSFFCSPHTESVNVLLPKVLASLESVKREVKPLTR